MNDPSSHIARIQELRSAIAAPMEQPGMEQLRAYMAMTAQWSLQEFTTDAVTKIGKDAPRSQLEALLREPLPEDGMDFPAVLQRFANNIAPYTRRIAHPRFLAFIPSAPSAYSILGDWLCTALNCFAGVWKEAAGAAQIELIVLDWLKEMIGYPPQAAGILTSGGSEANLTALVVARNRLMFEQRPRAVLYQSDQRHWSVDRSAMILGLHPDQIRLLPADEDYRLTAAAVARAVAEDRRAGKIPWAVIANGGTTNTGAVDDLHGLAILCREQNLWLHVDAAYGWAAVLCQAGRDQLRGLELADSVTCDPHKWLAQTYEAGCVLVRDGRLLHEAFHMLPEYMQDVAPTEEEINFADFGPALTRRFRALKIWLSIKTLGAGWFRRLVERCMQLAELTELLLLQTGEFEIVSCRSLSIVCFRYVPPSWKNVGEDIDAQLNELNGAIVDELYRSERLFVLSTQLRGRVALRTCYVNWRTTASDVIEVVETIRSTGRRLAAEGRFGRA